MEDLNRYKKKSVRIRGWIRLIILSLVLSASVSNTWAAKITWPSAISSFSGGNSYCQNVAASPLSVSFSTCTDGSGGGAPSNGSITVTWYSNTTNSTSGGNPVAQINSNAGTTTYTYTPSTAAVGTLYYYVVITWINTGNTCGNNSPLSTSTFTPSTQQVTVNPPAPSQPGAITGSVTVSPNTTGLNYTISPVTNATTYTWSVPTGWSITSGQGTTSLTVTSGSNGQDGNISVTAGNSCGTSTERTLAVSVIGLNCPASTAVSPSATQIICQGVVSSQLTANITTTGGSGTPTLQYQWYYNTTNTNTVSGAVLISGATGITYSPLTTASELGTRYYFCVGYASDNGCGQTNSTQSLASNTVQVTVNPPQPSTPGPVSGNSTVQPATSQVYSIAPVPNATTYTWTWPAGWSIISGQGTVSLTVTSGSTGQNGTISVTAGNSCGTSTASTLSVSVISSNCPSSTSVTPPSTQTICRDAASGPLTASVTLSGGSGTPTIQYQWYYNTSASNTIAGATLIGGATSAAYTPLTTASELGTRYYFCVGYATDNGCGQTNATQSLASNFVQVNVITTPATPGLITGNSNVNPLTAGLVYSIAAVPTASTYTWAVPAGWVINSGQGTTSISVTSGTEGQNGNITVAAGNACGTSASSEKAVTVTAAALPPTITLGSNPTVCQGISTANLTYSAVTESPDQYSINYLVAAEAQGFVDVVNATLPVSPIGLVVPPAASPGTYYGNLTVRNSVSGLISGIYSISVTVITSPATPALIFGSTTVPETTTGLSYAIASIPGATSYTWAVPGGWTITSGQGTTGIIVTSGSAGQNGNISVFAASPCGTGGTRTLAVTSETPVDHSLYGCNGCHMTHSSPGNTLTSALGNANLCMSCHTTTGSASGKPFSNADKANPGVSGNSHSWDVAAVNSTYETVLTSDPEMLLRIDPDGDKITCSTCHDQHNSNTNLSYTRISNAGDFMCKDCHNPRDVGKYTTNPSVNRGSHPVGVDYPSSSSFLASPTNGVTIPGNKVECSSCHRTHGAPTANGYLLRSTATGNNLCKSCHTASTHNGMDCLDCHQTHNTDKSNLYMIRNTIATPNSGNRPVVFTALTGSNSFADGNDPYNGICEVCHTSNGHTYHYNTTAGNHEHNAAQNCTTCHLHGNNFAQPNCTSCHEGIPTFNSAVHVKHKDKYTCSTCHFGHGSGGASEPTHPSGTKNIVFDPDGMARRNGLDTNTPVWSGTVTKTCSNIYCHSDGRSAYRGTDGTYTWSGTTGPQPVIYAQIPAWNSGTNVSCGLGPTPSPNNSFVCHPGPPGVESVPGYLLNDITHGSMINDANYFPKTGSHAPNRGAHYSNSQSPPLTTSGWTQVQCFWCHTEETTGSVSPNTKYQGTFGTNKHADGFTLFKPQLVSNGGTMVNDLDPDRTFSGGHCGASQSCW